MTSPDPHETNRSLRTPRCQPACQPAMSWRARAGLVSVAVDMFYHVVNELNIRRCFLVMVALR
jgi:hypothetical protein